MISREELKVGIRVQIVTTYRDAVDENGSCVYHSPEDRDKLDRGYLGTIMTVRRTYGNDWFGVEENVQNWYRYDVSHVVEDEAELDQPVMSELNKMLF